ncbi:GNAT family N-acetyltransferase [Actinoplanes sp. NPDC051851]|uniref:GNAT family N-acetyltransferase n=1 Tax=Actinoplanes sp. NPDC051851 TaxID=3154753 RepID=UPI00343E6E48
MHLAPITPENLDQTLSLSVRPDQSDLVSPVIKSLAEAYVYPANAWPRLILDGDTPVGFVMAFLDMPWSSPPSPRSGIWRLNIDATHQSRGYGRFAIEAVCTELATAALPADFLKRRRPQEEVPAGPRHRRTTTPQDHDTAGRPGARPPEQNDQRPRSALSADTRP